MASSRQPKHLVKRDGIFYFRIAIPKRIRSRFGCIEIKSSLRTEDRDVARQHCRTLTNKFELLFMTATAVPELSQDQLMTMAKSYFRELLIADNDRIFWIEEMWGNKLEDRIDAVASSEEHQEWLKLQDQQGASQLVVSHAVKRKLNEHGHTAITPLSDSYKLLCDYFLRAEIERSRVFQAKVQKNYQAVVPIDPLFTGIMDDTLPPLLADGQCAEKYDLGSLVKRFCQQKQATWAYKTGLDYVRVLKLLTDWFGEARPVSTLTTKDIGHYRDMLVALPKQKKIVNLPGYETLQAAIKNPSNVELITPKTADKYLQLSKAFLYWCCDEGYLDKVPGQKISIEYVANEKARHPFDEQQLTTLFSSSIWTGCKSESRRSDPGNMIFRNAHYWIPLIGVYTGLRLGEIIQLRNKDIRYAGDIPYFDINDDNQKKLKTKYSNRRVPIHPSLKRWGIMAYLDQRAKAGPESRVFNEISISTKGDPSNAYSKMFSRHLACIGIKVKELTFHSLRHTASDAFDNAGIIDAHRHSIMGHSTNAASAHYGVGASVAVLLDVISKISYSFEKQFDDIALLPAIEEE